MSNNDSFIKEVSEEVRKDQLYRYLRKHGWILGVLVAAIVGGTGFAEWRKSSLRTEARERGDAMLQALSIEAPDARAVAFSELLASDGGAPIILNLQTATVQFLAEDTDSAVETLRAVADDTGADPIYRDLAALKIVMLRGADISQAERIAELDRLATAGRPFRLLALEQRAMARIERGEKTEALVDLRSILEDPLATANLRQRAAQLTVALGGEVPDRTVLQVPDLPAAQAPQGHGDGDDPNG